MGKKLILEQINKLLANNMVALSITTVNHKPHPYTIGSKHVVFAANNWGGSLDDDTIREMERRKGPSCAAGNRCQLTYDQHTSDTVVFLQLKRNLGYEEARDIFMSIKPLLDENKIDGISLVDTPEKFRIAPAKDEEVI